MTESKGKTYFLSVDMYNEDVNMLVCADDDDLRGDSEIKEPLHYYGDDKTSETGSLPVSIILTPSKTGDLTVGKTLKLSPEPVYINGREVRIKYTWKSENKKTASVNKKGKVKGKKKGVTYIYAKGTDKAGNKYFGSYKITVSKAHR